MRYLPVILLLLCATSLKAQKKFEGVIHYLMVSADSSLQVAITAWYKKDKIKFTTELKKGPGAGDIKNETIIIDLQKSAIDRVKDNQKTVEREWLTGKNRKQVIPFLTASGSTHTILGYPCTEYTSGQFSKSEKKDTSTVVTAGELKFWYANELLFPVPDSLKMTQMIPLFTNGHIALGSEIRIRQAVINLVLHTEAKEIHPQKLRKSVFRHPKGYRLKHND